MGKDDVYYVIMQYDCGRSGVYMEYQNNRQDAVAGEYIREVNVRVDDVRSERLRFASKCKRVV